MAQMNIHFYKYQGTGNDFVILDNRNGQNNNLPLSTIKRICDRRFGVGADGLMLLNTHSTFDFEMIYYNADGNEGSMCGNGGRCLVQFAKAMGIIKSNYTFLASDGLHEATFASNGWVQLKMKDVNEVKHHNDTALLNTGSPHFIKFVRGVMELDVKQQGKDIRYSKAFKEKGVNVNFVEQMHDHLLVRTYERGVEDETLSCGTGVTASALVSAYNESGFNRVEVTTPGGRLAVEFDKNGEKSFTNIWLCGPATFVFEGNIVL